MLDLKSLLLNAGLVATPKPAAKPRVTPPKRRPTTAVPLDAAHREKLKKLPRPEQFILIRKWVQLNRLDKARTLDENCQKFYFHKEDDRITWLSLDPAVIEKINNGSAAIITYMSNSGLSHAVVPREIAVDVAEVFPNWIRVLKPHML